MIDTSSAMSLFPPSPQIGYSTQDMELAAAALLYIYCTCSDWTSLLDADPIEIRQSSINDDLVGWSTLQLS